MKYSVLSLLTVLGSAAALNLDVAGAGGNKTSPLQYGLIFGDINRSGDGGIYAELIWNRAFQAISPANTTTKPINVRTTKKTGRVGLSNPGYYGIDVKPQAYRGSFHMRGAYNGQFRATLRSSSNAVLASSSFQGKSVAGSWSQFNYTLTPKAAAPDVNNRLEISFNAAKATSGSLNFNLLSLIPPTYNDRPNGMRPDLMKALKSSAPSFLRFPGGNNLEGAPSAGSTRWIWNNTVGPLKDRPGRLGTLNYLNTDGIGLNEYFEWCQDLEMEPVLAVFSGHYLDNSSIPRDQLGTYVQDTLNELEYITGSTNTKYGALRASHGYPTPWKLKYVEIGNEDNLSEGLPSYQNYRFQDYYKAIKKAYPSLTLIASTAEIDTPAGVIRDYHDYNTPDNLVSLFNFLDNNKTTTLLGEYSTWEYVNGTRATFPYWQGTVAESIFLLGAERNADRVLGTTYAPILQNLNEFQWMPDLVSFTTDPAQTVYSASLQMLQLLSNTRIRTTRAVTANAKFGPAYWVGGVDSAGKGILKAATYNATAPVEKSVKFGATTAGAKAKVTILSSSKPLNEVTSAADNPVIKTEKTLTAGARGTFNFQMPDLAIAVLKAV